MLKMLARIYTQALLGMDACPVEVETDLGLGLPAFNIVGLPDAAVREAKERVRAGIANSGYEFPLRRITVNLAPADVRKEGPSFDLPIALSLLAASGQLEAARLQGYAAAGELSLDGAVRSINGALSVAEGAARAGFAGALVPKANAGEAALVTGVESIGVENLSDAVEFLAGKKAIAPKTVDIAGILSAGRNGHPDLADVKGQDHARRALEVAAAGGHNLLMIGPPGSGKTMLARRLPSILPGLGIEEAIEVTRVYSIAGLLSKSEPVMASRPFRSPHHTISHAGLCGGGSRPRPGEVSLSHLGVLFLDELPEFSRMALEALRQPLEDGQVTISRALGSVTFPAQFMLVAAMNPCNCGHLGDERKQCICAPHQLSLYRSRISGPLLDRIDIVVEVPPVNRERLVSKADGESSATVAARVSAARGRQLRRFRDTGVFANARMTATQAGRCLNTAPAASRLLESAIDRLSLSARAYHRILKVARTISDLDGSDSIEPSHVAEAISYRSIDRGGWHGL